MKTVKIFFMAFMAVLLVACDEDGKVVVTEEVPSGDYVGQLSVDQNDGTFYDKDNVSVAFTVLDNEKEVQLLMKQVKFAQGMPEMDVTIDSIPAAPALNLWALAGNNIVPKAMGGPVPKYTITDLIGTVTNDSLSVRMKCGAYPLTFKGKKN
jgi:hypothetical protein